MPVQPELISDEIILIAVARTVKASLNIVVRGGRVYRYLNWEQLYLGEPAPTVLTGWWAVAINPLMD
jgi:hypothetical protein